MNIDDKLRSIPVEKSTLHRDALKTRLLAHHKEITMKKQYSRKWLLVAAPALAFSLVAVLAFTPQLMRPDGSGNIAQETIKSLTPKQVFAQAGAQLEPGELAINTFYYMKNKRVTADQNGCNVTVEYEEWFTDEQGALVKTARSNANGKLIESAHFRPDGRFDDTNHYFDQSAYLSNPTQACAPVVFSSDEDMRAYEEQLAKIAAAYGFEGTEEKPQSAGGGMYLQDLRNGNVGKQKQVFEKLKAVDGWKVSHDLTIDSHKEKVLSLSYQFGPYIYTKLYFDQATLRYVGYNTLDMWGRDTVTVLEYGIKPLKSQ